MPEGLADRARLWPADPALEAGSLAAWTRPDSPERDREATTHISGVEAHGMTGAWK